MSDVHEEDAHGTHLSPEERVGLRLSYITLRSELNVAEQQNILKAEVWAFARRHDPVREPFGRSLHKRMLGDVWRWAGKYRASNKNLGLDFPLIQPHLYETLDNTRYWVEHETFAPDEIGVRFHHGLVAIHPFPNGNGRWSRLMADILVARLGRPRFTWGGGNLQDASEVRKHYIDALRAADEHDFAALLKFARS